MEIYWLRSRDMPWGDYGHVLLNGMSSHLPRIEGRIQFERTGPYVPPIMFPRRGEVIVTNEVRSAFDESPLGPLPVKSVDKARIVSLDWERWARDQPPACLPPSRDPEDFILVPEHDPALSEQIGLLWEMDPIVIGHGTYEKVQRRPPEFRVAIDVPHALPSVFRVSGVPIVLVREDAGNLLLGLTQNGFRLAPVEVHLSDS